MSERTLLIASWFLGIGLAVAVISCSESSTDNPAAGCIPKEGDTAVVCGETEDKIF